MFRNHSIYPCFVLSTLLIAAAPTLAAEKIVVVNMINEAGLGKIIGTVKLSDSTAGLVIEPDLGELTPGKHGFHIHQKPSCEVGEKDGKVGAGLAAGGHFDPSSTGKHEGPDGHGHAGDLPALEVNGDGSATNKLLAPQLKLEQIVGHALMIHDGSDNYSDSPLPLGGGGRRIACGIIE